MFSPRYDGPHKKFHLTPTLRDHVERIVFALREPGLQAIHGMPGVGKSSLAQHVASQINAQAYPELDPSARALYMAATGDTGPRGMKNGVYRLHVKLIGELKPSVLRTRLPETMVGDNVAAIRRKHLQVLFIDELTTLSAEEVRGVVHVSDEAAYQGWPLSIVLIGPTGDLLRLLRSQRQMESRVMNGQKVDRWSIKDFWDLLSSSEPKFPPCDLKNADQLEYVSYLHHATGGLPRRAFAVLNALARRFAQHPDLVVDLPLCMYIVEEMREGGARDWGDGE